MKTEDVRNLNEKSTKYSNEFYRMMRSTEYLERSLSVGSKNRLKRYQKTLRESRGCDRPLFDSELKKLLMEYAWNPQSFQEALSYLNCLRDEDGFLFSRNLKLYSKTEEAMMRFAEADHTSFRWNQNYIKALESLKAKVKGCKLKVEKYRSDDDILQALPKTDTHSGYSWILSGKKRKGDNIEGIYKKFNGRQILMKSGELLEGQPILIAFRTQAMGEFDDDGSQTNTCKHKTRVVSMYDILDVIDELQFANPFQKWINTQTFYAGGKNEAEIAQIISWFSSRRQKFLSVDYTAFDQTISSWLIEDAFSIIREAFNLDEAQERVFNNIVHRFIHKKFLLDKGELISDKGIPSGSMFTQIVGSIVDVLVVLTYFFAIHRECDMIAMGDDNAIFCDADIDIEHLAAYLKKNFGLIIKTDAKSNEGLTREKDIKFLSRYWTKGGCWRHPNQLISRMLFPERWRDYTNEVKPEHVLFAYILTYKLGMAELIDVKRFIKEHPISSTFIFDQVNSRYLPGSMAYIREYSM